MSPGQNLTFAKSVIVDSFNDFMNAEPFRLAGALAYFSLLSMAPMLLIVIAIAGFFFGAGTVQDELIMQVQTLTGERGADVVDTVLENAEGLERSVTSLIVGGALMLFGATTVFAQLQSALNEIWHVKQQPSNAILAFLRHRLLSFAVILVIGFLLTVSLVISAALAALETYFGSLEVASLAVWQLANMTVSFAFILCLVAMIFKYLPDALIEWKNVWLGALITTLLFVIGKYAIGLYLGQASIGSVFGAAGSVVVFMVWVYYAALVLFFGAEVTQAVSKNRGEAIRPSGHATKDDDDPGLDR